MSTVYGLFDNDRSHVVHIYTDEYDVYGNRSVNWLVECGGDIQYQETNTPSPFYMEYRDTQWHLYTADAMDNPIRPVLYDNNGKAYLGNSSQSSTGLRIQAYGLHPQDGIVASEPHTVTQNGKLFYAEGPSHTQGAMLNFVPPVAYASGSGDHVHTPALIHRSNPNAPYTEAHVQSHTRHGSFPPFCGNNESPTTHNCYGSSIPEELVYDFWNIWHVMALIGMVVLILLVIYLIYTRKPKREPVDHYLEDNEYKNNDPVQQPLLPIA